MKTLIGIIALGVLAGCTAPPGPAEPKHSYAFQDGALLTYGEHTAGKGVGVQIVDDVEIGLREDGLIVWRRRKIPVPAPAVAPAIPPAPVVPAPAAPAPPAPEPIPEPKK